MTENKQTPGNGNKCHCISSPHVLIQLKSTCNCALMVARKAASGQDKSLTVTAVDWM